MQKKFIYLIIGIVLCFLGLIIFIALYSTKPMTKLTNPLKDNIQFLTLLPDSQSAYYYDSNSSIKKWNLKTNKIEDWVKLPFSNVDGISYSPDTNMAIVYQSNPLDSTIEYTWLINLTDKKIVKQLSQNIYFNTWSPDSKKNAFQYFNEQTNRIETGISNFDGTNLKKLADLNSEVGIDLIWPNEQTLIYYDSPADAADTIINSLNLITNKQEIIPTQSNLIYGTFVTDQNKMIINFTNDDRTLNQIKIYDLATKETKTIGKNNLFLDKMAQIPNTNNLIAAYRPTNQQTDDIIKINTDTGKISTVRAKLPNKIDAINLMVSNDGKFVYFTSGSDFYKMKL